MSQRDRNRQSLWNSRFPCCGTMKNLPSLANSGFPFRGGVETACLVCLWNLGFPCLVATGAVQVRGKRGFPAPPRRQLPKCARNLGFPCPIAPETSATYAGGCQVFESGAPERVERPNPWYGRSSSAICDSGERSVICEVLAQRSLMRDGDGRTHSGRAVLGMAHAP